MLFDSSVRRELWRSFVGTLVVLLTVVLTMVLIRILSQATTGAFAPSDLGLIMGYTIITQLPMLLTLSLFISVVAVLSRFWRESEMVVWQVSGVPQMRFLRPLLQVGLVVVAGVALVTMVTRPWAQSQTQSLKDRYEQRSDLARVQAGQFQSSADGRRVFFIDSHSEGQRTGKNVFIVLSNEDRETLITAQEGRLETENGLRYLTLTHGERTETNTADGTKVLSRFTSARLLVGETRSDLDSVPKARALSTLELLGDPAPDRRGELGWRIGQVWSTFNMIIIGLGLAVGNARRSSNWNLVFALLVFVVYFNLLSISENWVTSGAIGMWTCLLLLHGSISVAALARIWARDAVWRPRRRAAA